MAETLVQTFLGNVGIGTDDPGAYRLKVNDSESSNVGPLQVSTLNINGTDNAQIPQYFMALWYGNKDDIPDGWTLCSGNLGTFDMRNRFIRGVVSGSGNSGGGNTTWLQVGQMRRHSHNCTSGNQNANHSHNANTDHYHRENATDDGGRNDGTTCQAAVYYGQNGMGTYSANTGIYLAGTSANHGHSGTTSSVGSGTAFSTMPPYRALCVIMKL